MYQIGLLQHQDHPMLQTLNSVCFNQWQPSLVPPMPMSLPQADIIEKFNGDLFDYPEFVQRFKTFIESHCTTDYQKLTCLKRYLCTEPVELIRGCHMYADKTEAYHMAWERLNNTYGRTKCLKDKVKAELFNTLDSDLIPEFSC